MDEAEYCDRISIMVAGRIEAMGTPAELKKQFGAESIDEVFVSTRASGKLERRGMNALWGLLKKESYHILRDRRTLAVLIFMPIVQVVLFGFSIRTDVKDVRLAIVDPAPDATTLEIRARLDATDVFRTVAVLSTDRELDQLFQRDTAQVGVVFEPGFAQRLASGDDAQILIITDATEPNTGSARQSYVSAVIQEYQREQGVQRGRVRIEPQVQHVSTRRAKARTSLSRASWRWC